MVNGDIGKTIKLLTGRAQTDPVSIIFCKPDGTQFERTATIDGDDPSIIKYTTIDGDIELTDPTKSEVWFLRSKTTTGAKELSGGRVEMLVQSVCNG